MTHHHTFPGRWIGAGTLILGPLLLLAGTLLRRPFDFSFPRQLAAVASDPALMTAAHTAVTAGNVLLAFAVITLAHRIGRSRPVLASWAATLVVVGLFERTFHAGIDQAAHGLVRREGVARATELVSASYQELHLFSFLSFTIVAGWPVLAYAAYRTGALGRVRAVALAATCALPLGVLKGTEITSVIAVTGLCVALIPSGVQLLRTGPPPTRNAILLTATTVPALAALAYVSTLG
ncbi:hypothetical protein ACFXGA_34410 [Actinosynnema sp. NPDC059335]|uniref:hypothetical protein n=1 Tax=Actinosynnema sp. NPDC059335 TaxID=3346804 RepID=UPI00366EED4F